MQIAKFPNAYEINISARSNAFLEFSTDNNIMYEIYTGPGNKIIPGFVFTSDIIYFGFCPKGNHVNDEKVIFTIMNFLLDLLEDKNAIAAYIYSAAEDLHDARERYFNRLYNKYNDGSIFKMDFNLGADGKAVMLYRLDNVNFESLQNLTAEEIILRIEDKEKYIEYYE